MAKATGPTYKVAYRRRRKNLTNYTRRLPMVRGETARLVVRKSGRHVLVQMVKFSPQGDLVVASAHSSELTGMGWLAQSNAPTAYLVGMLAGTRAMKGGEKGFHLDIGMSTPSVGNIGYCAALGAKDSGMECNIGEERIAPERVAGKHISDYAAKMKKEDEGKFTKHFSKYIKANIDVTQLPKLFEGVKGKIK
jgi:large subunit ribosomal protein L18